MWLEVLFLKLYDSCQFVLNINLIIRTIVELYNLLIGMDKRSALSNLADLESILQQKYRTNIIKGCNVSI